MESDDEMLPSFQTVPFKDVNSSVRFSDFVSMEGAKGAGSINSAEQHAHDDSSDSSALMMSSKPQIIVKQVSTSTKLCESPFLGSFRKLFSLRMTTHSVPCSTIERFHGWSG